MAIGDLKTRLRAKFGRRKSTTSSISRSLKSHNASPPPSIRESATVEEEEEEEEEEKDKKRPRIHEAVPRLPGSKQEVDENGHEDVEDSEDHGLWDNKNHSNININNNNNNHNAIVDELDNGGDNSPRQLDQDGSGSDRQARRDRDHQHYELHELQDLHNSQHPHNPRFLHDPPNLHHLRNTHNTHNPHNPHNPLNPSSSPTNSTKLPNTSITNSDKHHSAASTVELPTPNTDYGRPVLGEVYNSGDGVGKIEYQLSSFDSIDSTPALESSSSQSQRPSDLSRKQSLLPHQQTKLIKTLLETDLPTHSETAHLDYFTTTKNGPSTISPNMVSRKIWVRRPGASATLVTIHEDDLVDDVREMILKKYANSLGRNFDAPDVTLKIIPREQQQERTLSPDEPMCRTLDAYYPGGQSVDEALVIDVPLKRTPKPSPQTHLRYYDEQRPAEAGSDYFPQMPAPVIPSPRLPNVLPVQNVQQHSNLASHSISVLTTGQVPPLPSPGSSTTRRHHRERPRMARQHTASPTILSAHSQGSVLNNGTQASTRAPRSRTHSSASEKSAVPPVAPPLPTPPAQPNDLVAIPRTQTPPIPKVTSPRPTASRSLRRSRKTADHPSLPSGMLNSAVPPINVLIVEDNIINLKLLEAFMKRLKVRWQTAMNGREAVTKWRAGGFHLVLMDIQLPIMSGLEATKEIRRLERLNSIGVFSSSASSSAPEQGKAEPEGEDKLSSTSLFKSPVIIVALTASSLQSDRHEALAAGCNDFLTKPVNFVWLERKVMEWGCMQALIDFDGWRKWKDFSQNKTAVDGDAPGKSDGKKASLASSKKKKNRQSVGSQPGVSSTRLPIKEEENEGGAT